MITVTVTNRKAVGVPLSDVTVGAVGIPVRFQFTEDWDGLSKIAVFKAGDTAIEMAVFLDQTTVPHEVLTTAYERLWIGVYGSNVQGTVVTPTVWADIGAIQPGVELVDVDPSEPTPSWVAQVQAAAEEALEIATEIKDAAESGDFDGEDGEDGFSPIVSVSEISGGHQITITDADGDHTFSVYNGTDGIDGVDGRDGTNGQDGVNGADGISPKITVSTIIGGHAVTITDADGTKAFEVPDGENGDDGDDGISPAVTVTSISGGHQVTIVDAEGIKTFNVMDGDDGENGQNGVSPLVNISNISGGHQVTITDVSGSKSFNVMNGSKGDKGDKGDIGNVSFASFAVNPTTGILTMTYDPGLSGANFDINNNGHLEVII